MRVIGPNDQQIGVVPLSEALNMARQQAVDLVEVAPNASPPVCRLVDFGKFRYQLAKREKESKKNQHANKVKEIQLSASIDPHDFGVKAGHAIDFLCEEMKVKATLRFRGREMAHKEFGYQVMERFTKEMAPFGHPDAPPKLVGRNINVMFSPLPRNKRAKNPRGTAEPAADLDASDDTFSPAEDDQEDVSDTPAADTEETSSDSSRPQGFANNPFTKLSQDQLTGS